MKDLIKLSKEELCDRLWELQPRIKAVLIDAKDIEEARYMLFDYFDRLGIDLYSMAPDSPYAGLDVLEKRNARECIRVLSNTISAENEHLTGSSSLELLYNIARDVDKTIDAVNEGFLVEHIELFRGCMGEYGQQSVHHELFVHESKGARELAIERSEELDDYGVMMNKYFTRYKSGVDPELEEKRREFKKEILKYFGGQEEEWQDYRWHMKHSIKNIKTLSSLVALDDDEIEGLRLARKNKFPLAITPHYLSLFNRDGRTDHDRAVRAQVMPSVRYGTNVLDNWERGKDMDFMGEKATSPIKGITRRYPQIVIIKPFNSCPQICVYCQRNWEIKDIDSVVKLPKEKVAKAIEWVKDNDNITEVLITGGDPLTLSNPYLNWIIGEIASTEHVDRIRIGTRTPVTLPQRIDDGFLTILKRYHQLGRREVAIVTHFQHPTEIVQETLEAIGKIRKLGINVYNQQVFTYYNSRIFETALLRRMLSISGIEPYYSFNCMGKKETVDFRVPISRILQERKEEARLLPGLVRTDEPVFNVPRLGKSHLRAWQDHEVVMILADGRRIYRFYSWETELTAPKDYLYTDVSIYDYLKRLELDGENIDDYESIFNYF